MTSTSRHTSRTGGAAVLAALVLGAPVAGRAQVPGPDALEVLFTDDGPRVLLAGVGAGTAFARAAERLGGAGVVNAFFGGAGPMVRTGDVDGLRCGLMVLPGDDGRVRELCLECDGDRAALRRLAGRFRAALAALPVDEDDRGASFGAGHAVAVVAIVPARDGGWWARTFGPRRLRVAIRG